MAIVLLPQSATRILSRHIATHILCDWCFRLQHWCSRLHSLCIRLPKSCSCQVEGAMLGLYRRTKVYNRLCTCMCMYICTSVHSFVYIYITPEIQVIQGYELTSQESGDFLQPPLYSLFVGQLYVTGSCDVETPTRG